MTKAEKLKETATPHVNLRRFQKGDLIDDYVAFFNPAVQNSLTIMDKKYKGSEPVPGSAICLSDESAIALAKFLKELYLDEEK